MAINILQELNLGAAKASFSRDEVETLSDIKNLDVAKKYPNNYDIFCKEDGCKYRLNKTSHNTMQDNLPHPTGKWRRVDSVISSSMPAPITVGDVVLYLGPTVMNQVDHSKVKFQTGKYYRTEYTKVTKQMYAFVQNTAPDTPDTSPNPAVIWFSETSTLSEGSVLFTPTNGSIFDNKEHGIIMTSDWDGQSAISGSSYEYLDNSNSAKLGMVRNSNFDTAFDSFPELTWNMFDTEAELENIKQNVIPEAISSATEEIKTEVKTEVKEDVDANLGQAKKLNDILTDGDIKLLKQGGIEKLVSSKPNGTITDTTIGLVQCDYTINQETTEVTLNITDIAYGPFASTEEVLSHKFVDETSQLMPMAFEQNDMSIFAISCRVTNKTRSEILTPLLNSNLYNGTIDLPNLMDNLYRIQEMPVIIGYAVNAPTSDNDICPAADANEYTLVYRLLPDPTDDSDFAPPVPVSVEELPYIKGRTEAQLEKNTVLNLVIFVLCQNSVVSNFVSSEENILKALNEQIVIGSEASGVLNEFPTIKSDINTSILEQFAKVKKLNDVMTDADVDDLLSHPREPFLIPAAPSFFPIDDGRVIGTVFVKYTKDENGVLTITEVSAVSSITDLPGGYMEWISDGNLGVLYIIAQRGHAAYYNNYNNTILSATIDVVYGNTLENSKLTVNSIYLNAQKTNWSGTDFDPRTANYIKIASTHGNSGSYALKDLKCDWKDGAPVTLQEVYDSTSSDYYVISCMVEINPTVASPQDVTHEAITKDIIRRIFVGYEKTGLVAEFPAVKEQVTSVTQLAEKIDNRISEKTGDYINNSIVNFKKITPLSIPSSSSYSQDKVKFDGFVSLGVSKYNETDTSRSIAPVFKNYFDDTKSDYVTSDSLMTDAPTSWVTGIGWSRYVGIMGSIFSTTYNNTGKSAFENALHSTYCEYNRSKTYQTLFSNISTLFQVVDVYVRYYGNNDIDGTLTTGWIRVEPGANIWDLISGSSFYTGVVQVCVVVDGYYGDMYFDNAGPFIANVDNILNLVSFTDKKLDLNKIEDVLSINGLDSAVDATKSIIQKYPIKLAYSFADDTKFNGALKINADTYDPETTTSVSLSFYNYYDSSKDNYRNPANPATPMLVENKFVAVAAYIDIPEVLGIPPYTSAPQLKEHCKNISVRFDRTKSIKVDLQNNNNTSIYSGANVFIRDIYFKTFSTTQAPILASYTYSTKIINSNPIDELVDASNSSGFIPIFVFILEVIPDANYSVPLKNYLAQQNFAKFINSLCEISFNKVRDVEDKAQEAIENITSVAGSVDNISDSMSDYMSAKWLPTPIAFPGRALENEQEPSGNGKDYDFLLYPTFVDTPHSEGHNVEGKGSSYSVKSIPDSGNISVKALYESGNSMYLLFGFFGEKLLPESLGGDYTIPATYSESTIESFNRVSKTLWYSDIYMNMHNTFSYSMIKGINDSLYEIDISNIFLNFDPRVIKSLYAKVTSKPSDETNSTYTNRGLNNMEDFVKIPYANIQDTNTISMEDIVNMCGRPEKTHAVGHSQAVILFIAEIDKTSFSGLASLTTPAYGVSNTTSDILAIYQAMFANNSESSPIYMARSIDDSLKKTKEVAVEAARYAAATLTAAKHYDTLADLKLLIHEGESGYIVRNGETEGTSVADVYIKTSEGALIKIASGVEYEAPVS